MKERISVAEKLKPPPIAVAASSIGRKKDTVRSQLRAAYKESKRALKAAATES